MRNKLEDGHLIAIVGEIRLALSIHFGVWIESILFLTKDHHMQLKIKVHLITLLALFHIFILPLDFS